MSLILTHRKRIVDACYPKDPEEAIKLWHEIQGVKFGFDVALQDPAPTSYELAAYQIPEDAPYMLILRVECYTHTFVAAAPDFDIFSPPPPGVAFWQYSDVTTAFGGSYRLTPVVQIHILADVEEAIFAKGGNRVSLIAQNVPANPDANARSIRTLVYAYLISANIADRIGESEFVYFGPAS